MSLLDWLGLDRLREWLKYRNVDHFELRWRPPGGRGWRQVEDYDREFDPSNLDQPIPRSHFQTHAEARGYYQGEYRLVPIDEQGRMMESVWQLWFYDGPSLAEERREEERKEQRERELMEHALEETRKLADDLEKQRE